LLNQFDLQLAGSNICVRVCDLRSSGSGNILHILFIVFVLYRKMSLSPLLSFSHLHGPGFSVSYASTTKGAFFFGVADVEH
jgi:hypothetical protein